MKKSHNKSNNSIGPKTHNHNNKPTNNPSNSPIKMIKINKDKKNNMPNPIINHIPSHNISNPPIIINNIEVEEDPKEPKIKKPYSNKPCK